MNQSRSQFYHEITSKKAEKIVWQDLYGLASGFAIASAITSRPLIIVTPDANTSHRLEKELRFFLGKGEERLQISVFPGWETLPYDHFSPHEDVISDRGMALYQLATSQAVITIIDASTLMYRLPPKSYVEASSFVLEVGEDLDFELLRLRLESYGYNCVTKVIEHGEFAVRGSIVDIFPMGSKEPYRIDLLNTTVDSIRIFDVDTQRSFKNIKNIKVLPAKEFPFNDEAIDRFCDNWRSYFGGNPLRCPLYQSVSSKKSHPGVEYYLPFFFEKVETLFDYLSPGATIVTVGDLEKNLHEFWREINLRYEQLSHDQTHPILAPKDIFVEPEQILSLKNNFHHIAIQGDNDKKSQEDFNLDEIAKWFKTKNVVNSLMGGDTRSRVANLQNLLKTLSNARVLFIAGSIGRREALLNVLHEVNIHPDKVSSWQEFTQPFAITIAQIDQPMHIVFADSQEEILIITETQIFGEQLIGKLTKTVLPKKMEAIVRDLTELQVGSPVVHLDYGIGRYLGLQKIQVDNCESEFLVLEYADSAKLYVPVSSLGLISRYTGVDVEQVPLHHLGTKQWEKIKIHAEKRIKDTAAELLEIYANRLKSQGFAFTKPEVDYERFAAAFPFMVTVDQKRAIDDIISDMVSGRMMDRLICGDVGFGKTEVAMHAVFMAAYNGKQVAILAPTTLLAEQHFTNFQDRFAHFPFTISLCSRMRDAKELKKVSEGLANGKIDIVIGTHKLLQKNVKFKDLGLLVIDEEHRFGVKQKEYIKNLATHIDILALTATPIPRTLNMAFAGIRDFSIISTPPAKRLSIKTFICEYQPYLIKEAILRETLRGGQVYFLHNNITTIEKTARELQKLVPGAHISIAHGQMRKKDLEQVMRDFYRLKTNVLVCTTIIESGLDVSAANTIIINRADNFGLAQLHQLRGRVGRSHHQAYAYLVVPPAAVLSAEAKKRLDAIAAMRDLGTGFALAINDLEIRGAGELLGEKQSGVMQGIGFNLYMELLERAVKFLKQADKGAKLSLEAASPTKTEIELQITALIPDKYVNDVNSRLVLYKKIADAKTAEELDALQVEMIDRFGLLPMPAKNLFRLATLKLKALKLGIIKINMNGDKGAIEFAVDSSIDPKVVIQFMQENTTNFKFAGANKINFSATLKTNQVDFVEGLLNILKPKNVS